MSLSWLSGARKSGIVTLIVAGGLAAACLSALPASAAPAKAAAPAAPQVVAVKNAGTLTTRTPPVPNQAASRFQPAADAWPSAGSATLSVSEPVTPPLATPAAGLPAVLVPAGTAPNLATATGVPLVAGAVGAAATVHMSVLPHASAAAAGVAGVVFTAQTGGSSGSTVRVGVNYSGFAQVSGGNYGLTLGLEQLPACALTTPSKASCRKGHPLASLNNAATQTVTAAVNAPASSSGALLVLAAAPAYSDGGGAAGTYNATTLRPSGTWTAGGSDGSFTYSYPLAVPPAAGGLEPHVGLSYDSGAVDGQTASTQAQTSWVGDGWNTPQAFIEQSYVPCQDSPEGSAAPQATQDDCYDGPVLTLSLSGTSTPLVCPVPFSYTTSSTCSAASDNGELVTHHVSSGNGQGTKFTDYWTVTTRDGTTYSFGLNRMPGWASGDPATNSVDSVPVFSAHSGDPCYNATWSSSVCTMAYRWNLDYVTDLHGNAMAYYYQQDTNAYAQNGNTSSAVAYARDSHLDHIDYGFTDGNAYVGHAPDQLLFTTADRCFATSCDPIASNTANWPDVPYTQDFCATGATCQVTAPTFWSTVRLAKVATQQWNGSAYVAADSWALAQHFPVTGDATSPALWLDSVTRTGSDTTAGGAAVTLPPVTFAGTEYQNRVNAGNYPALYRYRITGITSETGSVTTVTYQLTSPCNPGSYPSPSANTSSCFPVYWQQFPSGTPDWFNKYAVVSVSASDPTGGSPGTFTSYTYSGAAWHYDDNEVVQPQYRTYGQWRGYQDVQSYAGTSTDPRTETENSYYQGMSDDNNSTDVTVTDSQGSSHEDANQLAGEQLETTAYTYVAGPVDHSQIFSYWVSPAAATRTRSGLPALTANFTGKVEDWTRQALTDSGPGTWRETETDTSYDTSLSSPTAGLPLFTYAHGDLSDPASDPNQQTCTIITYAPANTSENLAGLPAETQVDGLPCGGPNPGGSSMPGPGQANALTAPSGITQANVIADTRTYYDDLSLATTWPQPASPAWPQAAPGNADVSVTRQATSYNGSTQSFTYQTKSAAVYNSYGQVTASYDANGGWNGTSYAPTTTAYTMTGGSDTSVTVTNPLGQATTTALDPLRALPVTTTDPNSIATTLHYDGLGRLIAVWEYNRSPAVSATLTYAYTVSQTAPTYVITQKLTENGSYLLTYQFYDALLRPRQTQAQTPLHGSLVTDHIYDSHGWEVKTNTNYWDSADSPGTCPGSSNPSSPCIWKSPPDSSVSDQTVTQYDGLGRPVTVTSLDGSAPQSATFTLYTGDKTTTVADKASAASPGGTANTAVTDAVGRTTETDHYTAAPSVTTGTNPGGFATVSLSGGTSQATGYSYEARGWQSAVTDQPTGEQWTRAYNTLGQVVSQTTPNSGTTTMAYDADGNLTSTADALGHTITYSYDPLSRKTGEYDGTSTNAPQIASWTYDNSNNVAGVTDPIGQLTTATSTYNGSTYTFQQTGFNNFGESLGQTITLPASEGSLQGTYTLAQTYRTNTGLPYVTKYPASPGGALPAEQIGRTYTSLFDLPNTVGSSLQNTAYVSSVNWDALSRPAQAQLGPATSSTYLNNSYDPNTGNLTNTNIVNKAVSATPYDNTSYTYDPSGNITSATDVRTTGTVTQTEQQCYTYDGLTRLTTAWTTDGTSPCSAGPSTGTGGTVSDGVPGSAYWTSWTFNPLGNQTTQTQHSVTGGTDTVTTYTYTYNHGQGTSTGQPDTLTTAATTGPGAGTSTYTYNTDGQTLTRNLPGGNQTLTWYDNGLLKTDSTSAGTTSYVYDPSGNLLLQKDPGQTTLFIFGEQIVLNTTTTPATITGTRFIPLPDGGTVVRTAAGTNYSFELTNQQGTGLLVLDHTTANPVWRQQTPYGATRGTPPSSWPDSNGFLGKPTDTSTGLTILGARQYDPSTDRFLSVDPVLDTSNPSSMGGYAYAADNPATHSDPSGLCPVDLCGTGIVNPGTTHPAQGPIPCGTPGGHACWSPPPPSGGTAHGGPHPPKNPCPGITLSACLGQNLQLNEDNQEGPGNNFNWTGTGACGVDPLRGMILPCPNPAAVKGSGAQVSIRLKIGKGGSVDGWEIYASGMLDALEALLERLLADSPDPFDYNLTGKGLQGLTGPSDLQAGTEVADMTDPSQLVREISGEEGYNTVPKALVGTAKDAGDAVMQQAATIYPQLPEWAIAHSGDMVTSTALMVAMVIEAIGNLGGGP